eukprot:2495431-Pleurochrysis_carterae.AAC.1
MEPEICPTAKPPRLLTQHSRVNTGCTRGHDAHQSASSEASMSMNDHCPYVHLLSHVLAQGIRSLRSSQKKLAIICFISSGTGSILRGGAHMPFEHRALCDG